MSANANIFSIRRHVGFAVLLVTSYAANRPEVVLSPSSCLFGGLWFALPLVPAGVAAAVLVVVCGKTGCVLHPWQARYSGIRAGPYSLGGPRQPGRAFRAQVESRDQGCGGAVAYCATPEARAVGHVV